MTAIDTSSIGTGAPQGAGERPVRHTSRPRLRPEFPVLVRPTGRVQLGSHPERAVVITPPAGVAPNALAAALRAMDGSRTVEVLSAVAGAPDADEFEDLLAEIAGAGLVETRPALPIAGPEGAPDARRTAADRRLSVRVHGRGPLSDLIAETLSAAGRRVDRSHRFTSDTTVSSWRADLALLTDFQVPDPGLVLALMDSRTPHLSVRMRDGLGVVGPLVLPGATSCLACADLYRRDRDPEWPHLSAQLLDVVGHASRPALLATAAIACDQVFRALAAEADAPPATLDATVEVDPAGLVLTRRQWSPHPACRCRRRPS